MGVHYLIRNLENINGRLPFKLTFNSKDDFYLESDIYLESYKDIGSGNLQYIGIDGSVIIHSKIVVDDNNNVHILKSAQEISSTILSYVQAILVYFNTFNKNNEKKEIILHFVVDGIPPCKKNRIKVIDYEGNEIYIRDSYSKMSLKDKKKLHKKIVKYLNQSIENYNEKNKHKITLLTNYDMNEKFRGEGEIELYKVCQLLNKRQKLSDKNVIISSDSDVISLMLMHQDRNLVVISPLSKNIFITNYNVLTKALNLTSQSEIIKYVLLHFIYFGSDYNLGLMSNPNLSKQQIILDEVKKNHNINTTIDEIGRKCVRKRKRRDDDDLDYCENFLQKFKDSLIYEAICAFMYYYKFENGKKYLVDYSPRLYEISEAKQYIPLLKF